MGKKSRMRRFPQKYGKKFANHPYSKSLNKEDEAKVEPVKEVAPTPKPVVKKEEVKKPAPVVKKPAPVTKKEVKKPVVAKKPAVTKKAVTAKKTTTKKAVSKPKTSK
jgi:hypothetical protein